ncbi:FIST C-terminal domain-containing protein [Pseudanabaena sp. FACHB-1998]|uniref:FIST signal transduction protein n=1 Tax=Pseudanabaena sp. FACHB-1998 TaxID=2692858 RepID=UPI0016805578|nr:FIST N-terminal domain-containing protein [Pseudanabaena sp. FACHB-1998]MBD2176421.1 FIST C-terminal domain-containing protein [Pseudanabaena sp. FACHB-1998]
MKIEQSRWTAKQGWETETTLSSSDLPAQLVTAQLVLMFGDTEVLKTQKSLQHLKSVYPTAHILGCSTAGEIYNTQVSDGAVVATAIEFEHSQIKGNFLRIEDTAHSFDAGAKLAQTFETKGLVHLFVLSDGLSVNGSDLILGLRSQLPEAVTITGGLSGDGSRFQETLVIWDELIDRGVIAAIGIYSDRLKIGYGSLGGWTTFGPKRMVTKSKGNVLYELDGLSALELYKKYLGDYASGLPATGLLFPLSLYNSTGDRSVVRTILAVDEDKQNLTFAGDVPEGSIVQLMQANFNRLVDGAISAAQTSISPMENGSADLAILISCVGRKLVLKQRIEEEVEGVREIMGNKTVLTGFYSYGEIAPAGFGKCCELHNQTMTITTFSEQ